MLTEKIIRDAKPREKKYTLSDIENLFLLVLPSGRKTWQYRYTSDGKNHWKSLGPWPYVTIPDARTHAIGYARMRANGVDPVTKKRNYDVWTFARVADEWLTTQYIKTVTPIHYKHVKSQFERLVYPALGNRDISLITDLDIIEVLKAVQVQGKIQTAHKIKYAISAVFKYAKGLRRVTHNPVAEIERGTLMPIPRAEHFASFIKEDDICGLLRSFRHAKGHPWIVPALWFSIYTFVRPGNVRKAEWTEFDDKFTTWAIPAAKMKGRDPYIVPLATQVTLLLKDLYEITGSGQYLFPAARSGGKKPMSDMTINATLARLGYSTDQITAHGFRGTASTALRAHRVRRELVEIQLDHRNDRSVEAAYNHADFLPDRRIMMQYWADYLDALAYGKPEPPVPDEIR